MDNKLQEERLKKFKEMGFPMPMAPVDPALVQGPVRNKDFAAKLAAIKNGSKREEIGTIVEKTERINGFTPMAVPAPQSQQRNRKVISEQPKTNNTPALQEFVQAPIPGVGNLEQELYGNNVPGTSNFKTASEVVGRNYRTDAQSSDSGTNFLDSIKQKLAEKAALAQRHPGQQTQILTETTPSNTDDTELKKYITEVSSDVCKKLIKQFMGEFLTTEPQLIKETDKIKRAEMIREDIAKINGKLFKLTPVKIKGK